MTPESTPQRRASGDPSSAHEALVAAAIRLIQADGVSAATSRAVTDQAGMNLGAITYYFGSKDALIAEALAGIARTLLTPAIEALTSAESPLEQLQQAIALLPSILGDHPDALRGYVQALSASVTDAAVRSAIADLHDEVATVLASQIAEHQRSGIVPEWVHPTEMACLIVALVDGVAVTTAAGLSRATPESIGTEFGALLLHSAIPDRRA